MSDACLETQVHPSFLLHILLIFIAISERTPNLPLHLDLAKILGMKKAPLTLAPALSPFDILHVLDLILYHVREDLTSLLSCLMVCQSWRTSAATLRWKSIRKGITHTRKGGLQPSWDSLLCNMKYVESLHLSFSTAQPNCSDQITQLVKAMPQAKRLRSLNLRVHRHMEEVFSRVLPLVPSLSSLALELSFTSVDKDGDSVEGGRVDLSQILQSLPQLRELYVGFSVTWPELSYQISSPFSLTVLALRDVQLTAEEVIAIACQFPCLMDLRLSLSRVSETLPGYRGAFSDYSQRLTSSQMFVADLVKCCQSLSNLSFRYHPYYTVAYSPTVALLVRDIVASVAGQLRTLDVWKTIFHGCTANLLTDTQEGAQFSVLEKLFIPGNIRNRGSFLSAQSLQRLLERCNTLRVLDAWQTQFNIEYTMIFNDHDIDIEEEKDYAEKVLSVQHIPARRLSLERSWACTGLEYLSLELASMYPGTDVPYAERRIETFQRCRVFFEQISRLDRLRVAIFKGWMKFPCDLKSSGFHRMSSLKQLVAFSISFDWDEKSFSPADSPTDSPIENDLKNAGARWATNCADSAEEEVEEEGSRASERSDTSSTRDYIHHRFIMHPPPHLRKTFLTRHDVDWMVTSWPEVRWLGVGNWECQAGPNQGRLQGWADDAALASHTAQENRIRASMGGGSESVHRLWPARTVSIDKSLEMTEYLSLDNIRKW